MPFAITQLDSHKFDWDYCHLSVSRQFKLLSHTYCLSNHLSYGLKLVTFLRLIFNTIKIDWETPYWNALYWIEVIPHDWFKVVRCFSSLMLMFLVFSIGLFWFHFVSFSYNGVSFLQFSFHCALSQYHPLVHSSSHACWISKRILILSK